MKELSNQDFSFLCSRIWGNDTVLLFPFVLIIWGTAFFPKRIWG